MSAAGSFAARSNLSTRPRPQLKQLPAGTAFDDLRQTTNVCTWHSSHMARSIHARFTSKPDHTPMALLTLIRHAPTHLPGSVGQNEPLKRNGLPAPDLRRFGALRLGSLLPRARPCGSKIPPSKRYTQAR